jgi:hypothetical protein
MHIHITLTYTIFAYTKIEIGLKSEFIDKPNIRIIKVRICEDAVYVYALASSPGPFSPRWEGRG